MECPLMSSCLSKTKRAAQSYVQWILNVISPNSTKFRTANPQTCGQSVYVAHPECIMSRENSIAIMPFISSEEERQSLCQKSKTCGYYKYIEGEEILNIFYDIFKLTLQTMKLIQRTARERRMFRQENRSPATRGSSTTICGPEQPAGSETLKRSQQGVTIIIQVSCCLAGWGNIIVSYSVFY